LWVAHGKPKDGVIANNMRLSRREYHYAIRKVKRNERDARKASFLNSLLNNKYDFYKEVKRFKGCKSKVATTVNGMQSKNDIANVFAKEYESLYNSQLNIDLDVYRARLSTLIMANEQVENLIIKKENVYNAIKRLKKNKSDGVYELMSDNFIYGTDDLFLHLSKLFTLCLTHGYIPNQLLLSTLIPIPKDMLGDISNSDNYRGIALCCLCLKIFEYVLLDMHSSTLSSGPCQFAYKSNASTTQCTWMAREVIQHYNNNGSHVFAALLDCSKAFDKVRFDILFEKLITYGLSPTVIRFLLYSYTHSRVRVNWNNDMSYSFGVSNGVRQGAVLSPFLFNIYMEELICNVQKARYGCHVGYSCIRYGILVYADDILLLAPSLNALQNMLDICTSFGTATGLQYNCKKTVCIDFHGNDDCCTEGNCYNVYLNKQRLSWCKAVKHLGHYLTCCLTCDKDVHVKKGQFIACVNNILTEFSFAHHDVKLNLLNIYGTSFYGCQLWDLYGNATQRLYTTWNIALRRLIGLPYRTHRRFLDHICNINHIHVSLKLRFVKFIVSLIESENVLIKNLLNYTMTSNVFYTGLTLNRILKEFDASTPNMFTSNYHSVRRTILCQYEKMKSLTTEEMHYCGIIKEMLNCKYGTYECGLTYEECMHIIEQLAIM
jgi:hypothetical protein